MTLVAKLVRKNKLIGIRLNEKYDISISIIKKLELDIPDSISIEVKPTKGIFSVKQDSTLVTKLDIYSYKDMRVVLNECSLYGVYSRKPIHFCKCSSRSLTHLMRMFKMSSFWNDSLDNNGYVIMSSTGSYIGAMDSYDTRDKNGIHISFIEVISKQKGCGVLILKELFKKYDYIEGISLYSALGFWKKCGAVIKDITLLSFRLDKENFKY